MQIKIITAVLAGLATVLIVELFLRPKFPEMRAALESVVAPAVVII